jgi:tetratricopeptide (TPR) repeat protein
MTDRRRRDYLALLGIGEDAGREELEERYRELAEYFSSSDLPPHLQEWGREMAALVEEAYAVLAAGDREEQEEEPGLSAPSPIADPRHADVDAAKPAPAERSLPAAERPAQAPAGPRAGPTLGGGLIRMAVQAVFIGVPLGLVALGAIMFASSTLSGSENSEEPLPPDHNIALPLDPERIALLMAVVEEDPQNGDALFELGERFFLANEWELSIEWFNRLLEADPDDVYGWRAHAWTDIGTSHFNLGRPQEAKEAWLTALEIDPNDVQIHYNLGFYYANVEPVDLDSARERWQVVMELSPESDLARIAQVHLDVLEAEALAEEEPEPAAP